MFIQYFPRIVRSLLCFALGFGSLSVLVAQSQLTWPPALPSGETVVTDQSSKFLEVPSGTSLNAGVTVAKEAPTIDFLYFPGQAWQGKPWSNWGDALGVGPNKFYAAIGDHHAPEGSAQLYEYDAATKTIRMLVDTKTFLPEVTEFPEGPRYLPSKIHTRIDMGRDGWLYYATHRGSTRNGTDDRHNYIGDWILRTNPETGVTEVVAHGPVEKHAIPAGILDPDRMLYYGGTAPGRDAPHQGVRLLVYDLENNKVLLDVADGYKRYAILSSTTGKFYWDGKVYNPDTNEVSTFEGIPTVRAATRETPQGIVYGTSGGGNIWAFDTKTETLTQLGSGISGSISYITSMEADPTGRYLYYSAGAHGRSIDEGTPIMQFDTKTRTAKVIAFVGPYYREKYGYTPDGTFGVGICSLGEKLYVTWNGNRTGRSGSKYWDACAMMVIHIPESERPK